MQILSLRQLFYPVLIGVLIGALSGGCSSTQHSTERLAAASQATEVAAIDTLYANWRVAVKNGDIPSYVQALHPGVRLFPPGAPVIEGADNYAKFLVPVFASANYRLEVASTPKIEVIGDIATSEYEYIVHLDLKDPEAGITQPGALTANRTRTRYFDVLRKTPAGDWGVWRHTWSVVAE